MIKAGLDEVAVFIVSPFAGSGLFSQNSLKLNDRHSLISFSPQGRENYQLLSKRRTILLRTFFLQKLRRFDLWLQGMRAFLGIPQTKMENLPRRIIYIYWQILRFSITKRLGWIHESK
jgi:hypothetical protein